MGQSDTVSLFTTLTSTSAFAPPPVDRHLRFHCKVMSSGAPVRSGSSVAGSHRAIHGQHRARNCHSRHSWFQFACAYTNGALHNEQIGFANPMDFDTVLIIPLDHAANRFASIQHNHHGCASLHLLDVVKALGVRLIRRSRLSTLGTLAHLVLDFRK